MNDGTRYTLPDPQQLLGRPWEGRAILHMDLDAFFAAVEQLDHPEWRGKPVIVGGDPKRRGVVSTCSYEARVFGVHSAMASAQAAKLCPHAIWTHGNFTRYREMSSLVMSILNDESPVIQQVSIDEAFLDVTPTLPSHDHPIAIANRIRARVAKLGVTCSVGLSTSKTLAKIASDAQKPDGLTVIPAGEERAFLAPLHIRDMSGIGHKTEERLHTFGVKTLGDLAELDPSIAKQVFGINAQTMLDRAQGIDERPVHEGDPAKSVSNERSFAVDLIDREEVNAAAKAICDKVGRRLRRKGLAGRTVYLKLKFSDFTIRSAQKALVEPTDDETVFWPVVEELLRKHWTPGDGLRLIGVGISGFDERAVQLDLFSEIDAEVAAKEASERNRRDLIEGIDAVKNKFGDTAVMYGREFRFKGKDTGTAPQNKDTD